MTTIDDPHARDLARPIDGDDHHIGPLSAPVTLVEYGDYECPYCRVAQPIVEELLARLGEQLCFVFRHFPVPIAHPRALQAAEAAEAAAAQERFWAMHTQLFEHADALDDRHLIKYAGHLGLDVERFTRDLTGHACAERVREDIESATQSDVNGTPTFFLDGMRYTGQVGLRELLDTIAERHPDLDIDAAQEVAVERARIPRVVWPRTDRGR